MSTSGPPRPGPTSFRVAHLTTVDLSLQFLVRPQLLAVVEGGGEAIGVSAPGPWVDHLASLGIQHVNLPASTRGFSLISDVRAAIQLWRAMRGSDWTVLHTHNPKPGVYGRILGRIAGVSLVVNTMHGLYATEEDGWLKRAVVYFLEAVAARFSDVELHQNLEDLAFCKRWKIVRADRARLLGNGVDLRRFDPATIDNNERLQVRSDLGISDDQVMIGMVGRLVAEKGYPELFEAVSQLDERYVLVVIGPDDIDKPDSLPASLIDAARERGVRFLGMRTDVERLYAAMDIFVLPSHREGFPRAAMEAAAMGLPLVVTDVRGCRQVVDHEKNGLRVPLADPLALATAIDRIGSDAPLRKAMGAESSRMAAERFDERKVVEIVIDTYRQGLRKKGLGHLLPAGLATAAPTLRLARPSDARAIANLHASQISTGFLPKLGPRFLKVLYRALITWPDGAVLVAEDDGGPVGMVSGVSDVSAFYRHFLRRHALEAGIALLPRMLRPSLFARALESLRYGQGHVECPAEMLSLAIAPRGRGRGLSQTLGHAFLDEIGSKAATVKLVVGADNATAIGAWEKLGFIRQAATEVHEGEASQVMLWRRSS